MSLLQKGQYGHNRAPVTVKVQRSAGEVLMSRKIAAQPLCEKANTFRPALLLPEILPLPVSISFQVCCYIRNVLTTRQIFVQSSIMISKLFSVQ
jgi:hypothetical protein